MISFNSLKDPDTDKIISACNSLIGAKIRIKYELELPDGSKTQGNIDNCNIIGDIMENILSPVLKKNIPTIKEGPKQSSPDFYNREYEWELKCFKGSPAFDISNFISYITQLTDTTGVKRKLFQTQYLIFKYSISSSFVTIKDFKSCSVYDLIGYTSKYPITLQNKKGTWYNIRPCSFDNIGIAKSPKLFIKKICEAISECPNEISDKEGKIKNIKNQFCQLVVADTVC
mgnify:CR=1 FL=1